MIKIFCNYKTIGRPWGGANNFLKSLYDSLNKLDYLIISFKKQKDVDIYFFNQLSKGPGRGVISFFELVFMIYRAKIKNIKIITRCVNLNSHAFNKGIRYYLYGFIDDLKTYFLLLYSDKIIFQSEYQMSFFIKSNPLSFNLRKKQIKIIFNGANNNYVNDFEIRNLKNELILVSNTFSSRKSKNHYLISKMSLIKNVKIYHIGNWPNNINKEKIVLLGVLNSNQIKDYYKKCHYLLHPSIKDPCPNVIFEAISSNLPVLYNPAPGSSKEIVKDLGLPLNIEDLEETISLARKNYKKFFHKITNRKSKFSINYAAKNYMEFFVNPSNKNNI